MEVLRHRSVRLALIFTLGGALLEGTTGCGARTPSPDALPSTDASRTTGASAAPTSPTPFASSAVPQICQPYKNKGGWGDQTAETVFPQGYTFIDEARALGTSIPDVKKGMLGPVHCERSVSREEVRTLAPGAVITVPGFGARCILVGIYTNPGEQHADTVGYQDFQALCLPPATTA